MVWYTFNALLLVALGTFGISHISTNSKTNNNNKYFAPCSSPCAHFGFCCTSIQVFVVVVIYLYLSRSQLVACGFWCVIKQATSDTIYVRFPSAFGSDRKRICLDWKTTKIDEKKTIEERGREVGREGGRQKHEKYQINKSLFTIECKTNHDCDFTLTMRTKHRTPNNVHNESASRTVCLCLLSSRQNSIKRHMQYLTNCYMSTFDAIVCRVAWAWARQVSAQ